jgi:hypothetical protein
MSTRSSWDLRQLRNDVERLFGPWQREAISPCLNTIVERRYFARYHYGQARQILETAIGVSKEIDLIGRLLGAFDEEHDSFEEIRRRAAAHITACVHAMHSLPDVLGQVIYLALGMNRDPATELQDRYINIYAVRDKLPISDLRGHVELLIENADFAYLSVLNNMSKHRSIVPMPYSVDMTGKDPEEHGLKFAAFSYGANSYPERWVKPFLVSEFQRHEALVIEIGNMINETVSTF